MEEGNNRLNSGSFSAEGGERKDRIGWLWSNFFSSAGILVVVVGRCLFGRSRGVVERSRVEVGALGVGAQGCQDAAVDSETLGNFAVDGPTCSCVCAPVASAFLPRSWGRLRCVDGG